MSAGLARSFGLGHIFNSQDAVADEEALEAEECEGAGAVIADCLVVRGGAADDAAQCHIAIIIGQALGGCDGGGHFERTWHFDEITCRACGSDFGAGACDHVIGDIAVIGRNHDQELYGRIKARTRQDIVGLGACHGSGLRDRACASDRETIGVDADIDGFGGICEQGHFGDAEARDNLGTKTCVLDDTRGVFHRKRMSGAGAVRGRG